MKNIVKINIAILLCLLLGAAQQVGAQSPGGVSTNLQRWYKPEVGVTVLSGAVSSWQDQASLVSVTQGTAANRPLFNSSSSLINFHPTLEFDGTNDRLTNASGGLAFGTGAYTFYYVAINRDPSPSNWVFGTGASAALNGFNSGSDASTTTLISGGTTFASKTNAWADGVPVLVRTGFNGGATQPYYVSNNGTSEVISTNVSPNITSTNFSIGARPDGTANSWDGYITEVIAYTGKHTATDYDKVESYLSIKYGIPKIGNYVNSVGTTVWSSGGGYDNNIAGLARDDMGGAANTGLNQKQAMSASLSTTQVVMALGSIAATNAANANTFSADNQYFIWGDDNGSLTTQVATGNNTYTYRFSRIWKTQNTGSFAQGTTVYYPVSAFGNAQASTVALLYGSSAASLSSGTAAAIAQSGTTTINGVSHYIFTVPAVQIANMQFFSFTGVQTVPGGVSTNLQRWYRANADVTTGATMTWADQSVNGVNVTQATAANQPVYNTTSNLVNFNPALRFDGVNDRLFNASGGIATGTGALTGYYVAVNNSGSGRVVVAMGAAVGSGAYISSGAQAFPDPTRMTVSSPGPDIDLSGGWVSGRPGLSRFGFNGGASAPLYLSGDGKTELTSANTALNITATNLGIGVATDNAAGWWRGDISEVVFYTGKHAATDFNRVESYLATKYGITLGSTSNVYSYKASDGTTTWTGNATYQNNIAGIGRDDLTSLYQKQSQSVNTGAQVVMALGTIAASNAANANTFSVDKQYFIWGDDNGSLTTLASTGNSTYPYRFTRVWKTQNTGSFAQGTTVYYPVSAFGNAPASSVSLIYGSSTASLSSGTASTIAQSGTTSIDGVSHYIFTVPAAQIANLQFFSFTGTISSPGGVVGEVLWLRADAGTSSVVNGVAISQWNDQSINSNNALQATVANRPQYRNNSNDNVNFNPVVNFNGSQNLAANSVLGTSTYNHFTGFGMAVASALPSTQNTLFREDLASTDRVSFNIPNSGGNVVWNVPFSTNSISGSWGGSLGVPYVWTGWSNNGLTPRSSVLRNGLSLATSNTAISITGNNSPMNIGINITGSGYYTGNIGELVIYNTDITASQRQRVESYLAIKYGLTLGTTASSVSYLNSAGTTVWPGSSIYQNNVFGIGRDELTALHQQISRSSSSGDSLIFSTDANFSTANGAHTAISGDLKFLVAGHDGASMSTVTALVSGSCPVDGLSRIAREWKVYGTNTMDITHVQINLSAAGFGSDVVMLVCADSSFNTYTIVPGTFTKSSGIFRTKYTFANGRQFITFAGVPSTCTPCETGQLVLKNAATWQAGGTPARTANVITGVALGTVGSGAMTANLRVLDPSGVEYRPTRYPRTFKGSWLRVGRYDNSTTAALTYSIKLSQAAKADFEVGHIIKASGQATRVTFVGYCNGVAVTNPTLSRVRDIASRNTYTISGNVVTGTRSIKRLYPVGRVKVKYTQPVDSIAMIFTLLRSPVRKVLRSIFVSNINLTCSSPVEPTPDNVYMYQTFNTDTAYTCDTVTMQVKINNLNCTNKILNINNTLPTGLSYNPDSYIGDDVDPTSNPVYSGTNFSMTGLVVPPGEHSYYVDVYHSGTIGATTSYKNQTAFTVQGGSGTTQYSDGNIATTNLDSTQIVFKPAIPKVMPDSFIKSCDLSKYSTGGVLTYSFRFVNNSGSPITGLSFEDILDDQLTFQSATLSSSFGGTVLYTDDSASLTIDNMTIPTGTSTFSIKVNVNSSTADTIYNYASLEETVESECTGSTSRESNEVPTPRQLIDCIMVNPRVSQKLKAP